MSDEKKTNLNNDLNDDLSSPKQPQSNNEKIDNNQIINELKAKNAELEKLNNELTTQTKYHLAEIKNLSQRMNDEIANTHKYAASKIIKSLTAVMENMKTTISYYNQDNIDNTFKKYSENQDLVDIQNAINNLFTGIKMIDKEFEKVMSEYGVSRINPEIGDDMDPNYHQVVNTQPSEEHKNNTVIQVLQAGYKIHDRVISHALVVIAQNNG